MRRHSADLERARRRILAVLFLTTLALSGGVFAFGGGNWGSVRFALLVPLLALLSFAVVFPVFGHLASNARVGCVGSWVAALVHTVLLAMWANLWSAPPFGLIRIAEELAPNLVWTDWRFLALNLLSDLVALRLLAYRPTGR